MHPPAAAAPDLIDLPRDDVEALLRDHFAARSQPAYRVRQTLAWIYERDAVSFAGMSDLPAAERDALAAAFRLCAPALAVPTRSSDGTAKQLWRLDDGELIESVLIPAGDRVTLCISSQAGCAMACVFCATGWSGYRRQLTAGEIVAQFRGARRWLAENGTGTIRNIVFMGMGEPLANAPAVFRALTLLNHAYRFGARRITVSTVGIVPAILELADRPEQFRLAVSLHAPESGLRAKLIPIEKKYPLPALLDALRTFDAAGGRRITFEYVMIDGVNDGMQQARQLTALVREFGAHVNLIPYNPIPGPGWRASSPDRLRAFAGVLEAGGVAATIREPRGRDIAAACGQLRAEHATRAPRPYLRMMESEGTSPRGG
ncbi:MAG: 23S rRNA (adenine(2503)-C(2))-methyltransferase RlmN [Gemmatimonadota bacterium]|jgi:23S rRNA (adenine2503-C2)-methyltransferase